MIDSNHPMMTLRKIFKISKWYLRELSGESAYNRYLAHQRTYHPDSPVMSRREFERWRMDERERNTQATLLLTERAKILRSSNLVSR